MGRKIFVKKYQLLQLPLFGIIKEEVVQEPEIIEVRERPGKEVEPEIPTYVVGSMFLHRCHGELCRDPNEDMHYVAGLRIGKYLMLDNMIKFDLSRRSPISVRGEASDCLKSLFLIERYGYLLTAWFHSHPGEGKDSTHPSGTDRENQGTLEAGNYVAIGGIFSRDKYVRFFSNNIKFNIKVLGKGVEQHDENLFKITEA